MIGRVTSDTTRTTDPADVGAPGAPAAPGGTDESGAASRESLGTREASDAGAETRRPPLPYRVRQLLPGLVVLAAVVQVARPVSDPDTFWHLAAGDRLRQTWVFNGPDPWSTMSTQPWRLHEWLPELLMSAFQQLLGLPGVAWLLPLGVAGIGLALWRVTRRRGSLLVSAAVTAVSLAAMSQSLSLRPHLVTFALTVVTTGAWLRTWEDRRARWWLVPLTWVWACSHGMWFMGVLVGVVALLGLALDRRVTRRQWGRLVLVPLGSLAAAALTPTGPELLLSPFAVNETTQFIQEWMAPSIKQPGFAFFVGIVGVVVLVWSRSRATVAWTDVLLLVLGTGLALLYARTVAVGAAVVAPVAAVTLQGLLPTRPEPLERREVGFTLGLTALGLVVAAVVVSVRAVVPGWGAAGLDPALSRLPAGTVVCNDYGMGGWLIWRHPNVRPAIDGRVEVYSLAHVREYVAFSAASPGWTAYLTHTGCRWALVSTSSAASEALQKQTGWRVAARDSEFVLLQAPAGTGS
jgi:hypothetical protein